MLLTYCDFRIRAGEKNSTMLQLNVQIKLFGTLIIRELMQSHVTTKITATYSTVSFLQFNKVNGFQ